VATVLTVKGRIAAATYRIRLKIINLEQVWACPSVILQTVPLPLCILAGTHLLHGSLGPSESTFRTAPNRFYRLCPTDHVISVTNSNRPYLMQCVHTVRPNNSISAYFISANQYGNPTFQLNQRHYHTCHIMLLST